MSQQSRDGGQGDDPHADLITELMEEATLSLERVQFGGDIVRIVEKRCAQAKEDALRAHGFQSADDGISILIIDRTYFDGDRYGIHGRALLRWI